MLAVLGVLFLENFVVHLTLDDFEERDVRGAQAGGFGDERTAARAAGASELPDAPGNQVDQNVGVANFLESFFADVAIQVCPTSDCFETEQVSYDIGIGRVKRATGLKIERKR